MTDPPIRCACGCGAELPAGATRRRLYASTACRVRAARKRAAVDRACAELAAPAPGAGGRRVRGQAAAPAPDDELAGVLLELVNLIGSVAVLGREARPEHAWRCERLARDLRAAVADYFPEALR